MGRWGPQREKGRRGISAEMQTSWEARVWYQKERAEKKSSEGGRIRKEVSRGRKATLSEVNSSRNS